MSKVIVEVDLKCHLCYKEIRKILCKIQGPWKIKAIAYDESKSTVTLSGSFDPERLKKKLACEAKKKVKISFIEEKKKEEKKEKEKEKEKPKDSDSKPAKTEEKTKPDKSDSEKKPAEKPADKPAESAAKKKAEAEPVKGEVVASAMVATPYWTGGPACCYRPILESYGGGVRCLNCGRTIGFAAPSLPVVYGGPNYGGNYYGEPSYGGPSYGGPVYGGPSYGGPYNNDGYYSKPGQFFSDEEGASCSIM